MSTKTAVKTPKTAPKASAKTSVKAKAPAKKRAKGAAETPVADTTHATKLPPAPTEAAVTAAPAKAAKAKKVVGGVKTPKEPKAKKPSGLDAAAQVLADKGEPMNCKDIVETMLAKGLWKTGGKTPAATIYSAMLREMDGKPGESRFVKTGRGLFALTSAKA